MNSKCAVPSSSGAMASKESTEVPSPLCSLDAASTPTRRTVSPWKSNNIVTPDIHLAMSTCTLKSLPRNLLVWVVVTPMIQGLGELGGGGGPGGRGGEGGGGG